ncbi:MAG: isoamylase early set domain-containing protein [Deltaproteobacteria bacterium]
MAKKATVAKKIEFKITAPDANWVGVAGDFNRWDPASLTAKRDRKGLWKASVSVPSGTYEYKFVIDGNWITDPKCSRRSVNNFGSENSVLVVK